MNKLYGLLGRKLGHSLSGHIHKEIFKELNIDAHYHLFELQPENLEKAIMGLRALGTIGVNVTIPYKCDVVKFMDELSPEAAEIGAVNTIQFEKDRMIGYNTDYFGFKMLLQRNKVEVSGKNIVILGNGGAADSVLQFFIDSNCQEIHVATRKYDETKLKYKAKDVIICKYDELKYIKNSDIIVNCTPCGMSPNIEESPVEREVLKNFNTAVDLIYNPEETLFLKHSREQGLTIANGMFMLAAQAISAEEIWNNIKINDVIIEKIYESLLIRSRI